MNNFQFIVYILILLSFSGCLTTEQYDPVLAKARILESYLTGVTKYDGINKEEAVLLAQNELIFRGLEEKYYLSKPRLASEDDEVFTIIFLPVSKTLSESIKQIDLFVKVNKKDGRIIWQ